MTINVKFKDHTFIFVAWQRYRTQFYNVAGKGVFPDYVRISNEFPYWDVEIGFRIISPIDQWQHDQTTGVWKIYSTPEIKHIANLYVNMYGKEVSFNDIEIAKSRVDELLIKFPKLGSFS